MKLVDMSKENPKRGKFIAIYDDSSGANIHFIDDNGDLYDYNFDSLPISCLKNYSHWIELPDDYKLPDELI